MLLSGVSKTRFDSKTRGLETRNPAARNSRRAAATPDTAILTSFSRSSDLRPFIREFVNGAHAIGQRLEHRAAPADGSERDRLLVGLLVGGSVEEHGRVSGSDVFLDGNQ